MAFYTLPTKHYRENAQIFKCPAPRFILFRSPIQSLLSGHVPNDKPQLTAVKYVYAGRTRRKHLLTCIHLNVVSWLWATASPPDGETQWLPWVYCTTESIVLAWKQRLTSWQRLYIDETRTCYWVLVMLGFGGSVQLSYKNEARCKAFDLFFF